MCVVIKLLHIMLLFILLLLYTTDATQWSHKKPPFRIAVVMGWIGGGNIPASGKYFFSSVAANSNILDLLLFHEDNQHLVDFMSKDSYSNIHVYDLGHNGFSTLSAQKMGSKLSLSSNDISELAHHMATIYRVQPKWTLEIRPAFGSIFEDYLTDYTHWLYMDMDEILGDIPAWLEMEELTDFHMVTLATGDSHRVYMRGPFTMINTTHEFPSLIWKKCSYLSSENIMNYFRFKTENCIGTKEHITSRSHIVKNSEWNCGLIPDEAEFSERVINTPSIRLKIASKSLADPAANRVTDIRPDEIFWIDGAVRFCTNKRSCDPTRPSPFRRRMLSLERRREITMPLSVDLDFPGMRIKKGERTRVLKPRLDGGACQMAWTRPWGRCLRTNDRRFDLYLIDKFWWKQDFAFAEEEQQSAVSERMIVHFRSWKHKWSRLNRDNLVPKPSPLGGGRYIFSSKSINTLE